MGIENKSGIRSKHFLNGVEEENYSHKFEKIWLNNNFFQNRHCKFNEALISLWLRILQGTLNFFYIRSPLGAFVTNTILIQTYVYGCYSEKIAIINCSNRVIRKLLKENDVFYTLPQKYGHELTLQNNNKHSFLRNKVHNIKNKQSSCIKIIGKDVNLFMGFLSEKWPEFYFILDSISDVPQLLAPDSLLIANYINRGIYVI